MTYPLPIRSAGESAANHAADHSTIHDILGVGLPVVTTNSTGHLANHTKIHTVLNTIQGQSLPTNITAVSTGHIAHHNTIHALLNAETYGPRGAVGQIADVTSIAGYPGTFTATLSAGATTIQNAIAANGSGAKFLLQPGTYAITSSCNPKSGQEFWCQNGVTITRGGSTNPAFNGSNGTPNVKIMNAKITGFNVTGTASDRTIAVNDADGWQVAYCDLSATWSGLDIGSGAGGTSAGHWFHHNYFHDILGSTWGGVRADNCIWEDNEFFNISTFSPPTSPTQHKFTFSRRQFVRHNYFHGAGNSPAIWFDTADTECIIEWNRVVAGGQNTAALVHEQDCYAWQSLLLYNTQADGQIIRYNKITGWVGAGILMNPGRWFQVYGNILEDNGGTSWGNIHQVLRVDQVSYESHPGTHVGTNNNARMDFNSIHHNYVAPSSTSGKAIVTSCPTVYSDGFPYDTTQFVNNTMQNNYDFNAYDAATVGAATNQWTWMNAAKNWTTWRAVPQVNGTGATQDVNGSRS